MRKKSKAQKEFGNPKYDPLVYSIGPFTRSKDKALKEVVGLLIKFVQA